MDPLYIVELQVEPSETSQLKTSSIYNRLVDHAYNWLTRDLESGGPNLLISGQAELPGSRGKFEFVRSLRWTTTHTEKIRALSCTMHQPVKNGKGAQFICELTIFQQEDDAQIRIELGRESVEGLMSPVPIQAVRRPGILATVVKDSDLRITYQGQLVDSRYEWINPPLDEVVPQVLAKEKRLPILLIDGEDKNAKRLGGAVAEQLSGLARVILVDRRSQNSIEEYLESIEASLPSNGARLVWPILNARHPEFWNLGRTDAIINTLMKIVASVSVSARSTNRLRTRIAEENRRTRENEFRRTISNAAARGDSEAELETLRERVAELDSDISQWIEEVDRLTQENESLMTVKSSLAYWKGEAQRAQKASSAKKAVKFDDHPNLESDDLSTLAAHLEDASSNSIVFTAGALRSWPKSNYPHVEAMEEALVKLARASSEWSEAGCNVGMRIKEWLKTRFGLNFSLEDEPLVRKNLNEFEYDGKNDYSREPHLKLDDFVKPNEVGRIYFAIDTEGSRFIVDHVGVKLYGI
ncbi:hypothetical protein ACTXOW_13725 [Corynebacterium variabile]|uniref:hypothetical protein n=1 Tax=Corynebacterium variabile TaxID=1727 RepID=UPI003FD590FA